jgi:hypothetical protein
MASIGIPWLRTCSRNINSTRLSYGQTRRFRVAAD